MKHIFSIAMLLWLCVLAAPAAAQSGWILVLPPVDEAKIRAVRDEVTQPVLASYGDAVRLVIRRSVVQADAPLSRWTHWAAYDLAAECESGKTAHWEAHRSTHRYLAVLQARAESKTDALQEKARLGTLIELGRLDAGRCVPASVVYGPSR